MPIYSENIRTRKAAIDGQYDESGGRIHPTDYVVHHEVGGLLPKLTEVDHAGGRVDLAKCYLSVETTGTEQADDAYTYLDQDAADPQVSCCLIRPAGVGVRSGHTDERSDVRSYIEAYQIKSGLSPWYLRGLHTAGMRNLVLWARETARLPEVGQTLYLVSAEGTGGEFGQYVQISDYSHEVQAFLDGETIYSVRLIYLALTSALGAAYSGPEVARTDPSSPTVKIRETVVADGSRYYGRSAIAAAVSAGATALQVGSIYGQIAPSARGETALANLAALSAGVQTITSGGQSFAVSGPVHTQRVQVTAGNRRTTWTRTLIPIPATGGQVRAHVRILDRWYTVVEGETGTVGTLTCNRTSGSTLLSLSALPDADTWIIWEWPSGIHFTDRAGTADVDPLTILVDLPSQAEAGTLVLTWTSGGVAKTASEAATGVISGHCAGYRVGQKVALVFTANLPDGGTQVGYEYDPLSTVVETITPTMAGNNATFTLDDPPREGSVQVTWTVKRVAAAMAKASTANVVAQRRTVSIRSNV